MSVFENFEIEKGLSTPFGTTKLDQGVNFAFFSEVKNVFLKLKLKDKIFDIPLNKTGNIFHVEIRKLPKDTLYAYEVDGKIRQDPWGKSFHSPTSFDQKPNKNTYLFSEVVNEKNTFDWQGVKKPKIKDKDLVIYEMHVRSFTNDVSAKVKDRGSFLGIIEKIDHLKKLGVTAIELMPIYEFDETAYDKINPLTKKKLNNYWGYEPVSFFSIMKRYGSDNDLKTLIRELHKNEIAVILDVVYNHRANPIKDKNYYLLDENGNYLNFSGCGNTFNCNSEIGSKLILDSLIYFSKVFHVDGFRFDLASILTRSEKGKILKNPPILKMIKNEKMLKDLKFIAEPWDASGLYQSGFFEKYGFFEWRDKFRDVARKFIRGDRNTEKEFVESIIGNNLSINNADKSINYITCHDGFTLMDLVSFEKKHNLVNGEDNRDGSDNNLSSNSGVEGPILDQKIQDLRLRKAKNLIVCLLLAKGTPMLLMGDEYLHSRDGNNNAWCQDNSLNYFLWNRPQILTDFITSMIKFRKKNTDTLSHIKLDKNISKIADRFVILNAKDLIIIFNSNDKDISINLNGKYKIILATFKTNADLIENLLTLKSYSCIILKKQD